MMATGYFGMPGKRGGMIHVVAEGKPVCGARVHPKAEFQWCAHGIQIDYVECVRCLNSSVVKEHLEAMRQEMERRCRKVTRRS